MVSDALNNPFVIDDEDQFFDFVSLLSALVAEHFGGSVHDVKIDNLNDDALSTFVLDTPEDGLIYQQYVA